MKITSNLILQKDGGSIQLGLFLLCLDPDTSPKYVVLLHPHPLLSYAAVSYSSQEFPSPAVVVITNALIS